MFISNVVLPHPDLPIIKPLIPLGSRGDYNVYFGFHFKRDFLLLFYQFFTYILSVFLFFLILKMYCLKCRRVTETENIPTAMSKNGRIMRRSQCITCGKTKTRFIKRDATGGSFLNTLVSKLPFKMHLPGFFKR